MSGTDAGARIPGPLARLYRAVSPVDSYIGGIVVAAVVLLTVAASGGAYRHEQVISVPLLTVLFAVTGSYVVQIKVGRQHHTFQFDDVPRLIGLVFLSPGPLIFARLVGAFVAFALIRRQALRRVVFNTANCAIEVAIAIIAFRAFAPAHAVIGPALWPAALAATLLGGLASSITVTTVISIAEQRFSVAEYLRPAWIALGTSVAATVLGLVSVTVIGASPDSGWLLIFLFGLGVVGYRAYVDLQQRTEALTRLRDFLASLTPVTWSDERLSDDLERIRDLLNVDAIRFTVPSGAEGFGALTGSEPGAAVRTSLDDARVARLVDEAAKHGGVVCDPPLQSALRWLVPGPGAPRREHMAAPVHTPRGVVGVIAVTQPLGDRHFKRDDADMLELVASQIGQALHRGEQQARLQHAATHDGVTGLANLQSLRELGGDLVRNGRMALLELDVRRLRAINDVFGREAGDEILREVARRVQRLTPAGGMAARVGGHHLALLTPLDATVNLLALAQQVRRTLEMPVMLSNPGSSMPRLDAAGEVGVNVGIAVSPLHGRDIDVLLRRAEAALDVAKQDPAGVAVFSQEQEVDAERALRLVSDLRRALADAETAPSLQLRMAYQPKICVLTGEVLGAEALIRWEHPQLGNITPDEFIPLAESAGLIALLTRFVLTTSLRECRRWHNSGHPVGVAVNISALSLSDAELATDVRAALLASRVPAGALTLELTETSVMAHPAKSRAQLSALKELGVRLSVDDFGTGYSSLGYLHELPLDEVKLDRSFVAEVGASSMHFSRQDGAAEFLRHTIALAHTRSLQVVVEGVEHAQTLQMLREVSADAAQGYHICRPQEADAFLTWLDDRATTSQSRLPRRG